MDFIIELLSKFDSAAITVICTIILFIVLCFIGWTVKNRNHIIDIFNQWAKNKQDKDELIKIIYNNQQKIKEYAENRTHDREQSLAIQKQLTDAIGIISTKLDDMEIKHNKRIRAEMKDKIGQQYRYYHEKKKWNEMEREALNDLIEEYEDAGGKNSFVHSVVQPESYLWEVVDRK